MLLHGEDSRVGESLSELLIGGSPQHSVSEYVRKRNVRVWFASLFQPRFEDTALLLQWCLATTPVCWVVCLEFTSMSGADRKCGHDVMLPVFNISLRVVM